MQITRIPPQSPSHTAPAIDASALQDRFFEETNLPLAIVAYVRANPEQLVSGPTS